MAFVVVVPQLLQIQSEKLKLYNIVTLQVSSHPLRTWANKEKESRASSPRSPCRQALCGHTRSLGTLGNAKAPLPSEKPAYEGALDHYARFPVLTFRG